MNKLLLFGAFVVGAAVGSVVTYKFTYRKLEDDFIDRLNEELDNLQYGDASEEDDEPEYKEVVSDLGYDTLDSKRKKEEAKFEHLDRYSRRKIYKKEAEKMKDEPLDFPYAISEDDFFNTNNDYEKITLYFYKNDEILLDDAKEIVDNVEELVGNDTFNYFTEPFDPSGSPDLVYIRNDKMHCDFEIVGMNYDVDGEDHEQR